ncbi:hypothetical protein GALL_469990 [mine drainage metagenome]|uniref:Aminoglycoside phosphotransferase domain-containing protein n=1 Tax=mine drainage metagenome TaxID=410659 RepID=A0A1J5PIF8_9ZZZZ
MTWKALYANRQQPLLVPCDLPQARRAIAFFVRNPLLRLWGNLLLTLDRWLPRAQLLPKVRIDRFPHQAMFGGSSADGTSLFCGIPGPLQKLILYCPESRGGPGAVAKIALQKSADKAIAHETYWLLKLNRSPSISRCMPRLLMQGTLGSNRHYFSMLSLPQGFSPKLFGKPHDEFLHLLARPNPEAGSWNQSQAYVRLYQRTHATLPLVEEKLRLLWLDSLAEIDSLIGRAVLPTCIIHGDFAPWNLRQIDGELFLFDWEFTEEVGNPLLDFLHFHLIPLALQRWPLRATAMPTLLGKAALYADRQFGSDSGVAAAGGAMLLHYLLDTLTFYVAASGHMDYTHPVLRTYSRLLEQRKQWLPNLTVQPR